MHTPCTYITSIYLYISLYIYIYIYTPCTYITSYITSIYAHPIYIYIYTYAHHMHPCLFCASLAQAARLGPNPRLDSSYQGMAHDPP